MSATGRLSLPVVRPLSGSPMPCAASCPVDSLGALGDALTERPVASVVAVGATVGAFGGALAGLVAAAVARQRPAVWAVGGALVGAAVMGVASYGAGSDLERWLAGRP